MSIHGWKRKVMVLVAGLGASNLGSAIAEVEDASPVWITSWNAYSKQSIDPPVFRVLPLAWTAEYRAVVSQNGQTWSVSSPSPTLSLAKVWPRISTGKFSLTLVCTAPGGRVTRTETGIRVKAPDFKGFKERPTDWAAAADRNIAYLINANAICHEQYPDGQFSTWGRDYQTGKSLADEEDPTRRNWFNGNAFADWAPYKLTLCCKTLTK
jgi:hypothetical protein